APLRRGRRRPAAHRQPQPRRGPRHAGGQFRGVRARGEGTTIHARGNPMKRHTLLMAVFGLMFWGTSATARDADGENGTVATAVKKAGGSVNVDFGKPDKPVVAVMLNGPKLQKFDLTQLKDLPKLRRLFLGGPLWTDKEME